MTNREENQNTLSSLLCGISIKDCISLNNGNCPKHDKCRILEKTDEQLNYISSPINSCVHLKACAGSGKTEVLGMKASFEISKWFTPNSGIAVLTFTNDATNTIRERISQLYPKKISTSHFIGTFDSFIQGYITQVFGYALYRKDIKEKDKSFSLVSSDVKSYNNRWLDNYKIKFPTGQDVYANQIEFCASKQTWVISLNHSKLTLEDYYNQPKIKTIINNLRKKGKNNNLFKLEYFTKKTSECKNHFWKSGFATFEDMKYIAYKCLKRKEIAEKIAKKFPLIMVDECQDLSCMELILINLLKKAGSNIHYIGDLNQAVYSFKDADPKYIEKIVNNNFKVYELNDNFRSNQEIVDVANALQEIKSNIIGHMPNVFDGNKAVYYEYENETDAPLKFKDVLTKNNIIKNNAIVLTRSNSLKQKIRNGESLEYRDHTIINALQLWGTELPENKKEALQLLGLQMQKWLGTAGNEINYYCPENIYSDVHSWRLILRDILNELTTINTINDFGNLTYGKWYGLARDNLPKILTIYMRKLCIILPSNISIRTPPNTGSHPIQLLNCITNDDSLNVETIHASKGCTYDAVLLVSSKNSNGTGYWEKWIDDKNETTRFAYVACTRPKHLLCWAVPKLNKEQRRKIESIGLQPI